MYLFMHIFHAEALVEFCKEVAAAAPDLPFLYYHLHWGHT